MHTRQKHQVAGTPGVKVTVCEDSGHPKTLHLRDIVPAEFAPLVGQRGIDPCVVRSVAHGVVVKKWNRFMQIVQHLRTPIQVSVEHVPGQIECHGHGIAVVIVSDVMAPVNKARPILARMRFVPFVHVDHAVAAIHFHDGRDEHDHVGADVLDIGRIVYRKTIGEFHQRRGSTGLRRVDCARDVINRPGLVEEWTGFRVVEIDRARVRKLG